MPAATHDYQKSLASLEPGDSYCFARKLNQDGTTRNDLQEAEERLSNVARSQMARAKAATGHKFSGDLVNARAPSTRDPIIIYVVTRIE